jgi:uncharacterized membrane protein (DUF373 family)
LQCIFFSCLFAENGPFCVQICILRAQTIETMGMLLLNAFYDNVNKNTGPTLMWFFTILLAVELIYVMVKYLGSEDQK